MEDGVAIDIGGREERLCSGDSLDILNDAACGIGGSGGVAGYAVQTLPGCILPIAARA
jgi:hypothetical protein